jgi:hypothetical protein
LTPHFKAADDDRVQFVRIVGVDAQEPEVRRFFE